MSQSGDTAVVTRTDTKQQLNVKLADLERVNPPKFNKIEDMTNMAVLNPPSVLFNLKDRYYADLIYVSSFVLVCVCVCVCVCVQFIFPIIVIVITFSVCVCNLSFPSSS